MKKKTNTVKPIEVRDYVSAAQVVKKLNLSPATVRNAIKRGTVPGFKMGRNWMIDKRIAEKQWNNGETLLSRGFKNG